MRLLSSQLTLKGRLGRIGYFARMTVVGVLNLLFQITWFNAGLPYYGIWVFAPVSVVILCVLLAYCYTVRRFHDLDQMGVLWGLIALIPFVALLFIAPLLFFRGSKGPNRYGH